MPSPTAWTFDPLTLCGLALLLGAYLYAVGPLRRRLYADEPLPTRRLVFFVAGWLSLALTLITPLDALGRGYLFVAHTAQLFIITTICAPLLLLGVPEWLAWLLLPTRDIRNATRGLGFTLFAILGFNGIILIWHIPQFYEVGLRNMVWHAIENLSFLIAGLLTWYPLLTPLDAHRRLASPVQILYLVAESLPLDVFGAFTFFAPGPFYQTYIQAPRLWGLSALADQAAGGAILAVPGNFIDLALMSLAFFGWLASVERAQVERERQADLEAGGAETADVAASDGAMDTQSIQSIQSIPSIPSIPSETA